MLNVSIVGEVPAELLSSVAKGVEQEREDLRALPGNGWDARGLLDLNTMASLTGAIVALAGLVIQIWQAWPRTESWTATRLREAVSTELAARGIVRYRLLAIEGFEHLLERSELPCKVKVCDSDSEHEYQIGFCFKDARGIVELI